MVPVIHGAEVAVWMCRSTQWHRVDISASDGRGGLKLRWHLWGSKKKKKIQPETETFPEVFINYFTPHCISLGNKDKTCFTLLNVPFWIFKININIKNILTSLRLLVILFNSFFMVCDKSQSNVINFIQVGKNQRYERHHYDVDTEDKKCHCPFESTIVLTLNLQLEKCMAHKEWFH